MDMTALFQLSYGVYVVGVADAGRRNGCMANSLMQVTAEPPGLVVGLNKDSLTAQLLRKTGRFSVSVLGEKVEPSLIGTFGFRSGKDCDKYAEVNWEERGGLPILPQCCAYALCEVRQTLDLGTHWLFYGEVTDCGHLTPGTPMTYAYYHRVIKGTPIQVPKG
ncbi:MAG: flavin reductase family protein [Clostridiales bacterium]|nr:flavin reductase family protein [Clostridiales bacterium]